MGEGQSGDTKKTIVTIAALLAIVLIVSGAVVFNQHGKNAVAGSGSTATSTSSTQSIATYKDGAYMTTASYDSPAGRESIGASVTLKGNVVTDSTVTSKSNDPAETGYQQDFIDGYKQQVTGKNINSISLSRVSGSSLTSNGCNDALKTIKSQAKA